MKKRIKVSYSLPPDLIEAMKAVAERRGLSASVFVQLAIENYLKGDSNNNNVEVKAKTK